MPALKSGMGWPCWSEPIISVTPARLQPLAWPLFGPGWNAPSKGDGIPALLEGAEETTSRDAEALIAERLQTRPNYGSSVAHEDRPINWMHGAAPGAGSVLGHRVAG